MYESLPTTPRQVNESSHVLHTLMCCADLLSFAYLPSSSDSSKTSLTLFAGRSDAPKLQKAAAYIGKKHQQFPEHIVNVCVAPGFPDPPSNLEVLVGEGDNVWNTKAKQAYCREGEVDEDLPAAAVQGEGGNPLLAFLGKMETAGLIGGEAGAIATVKRDPKYAGDLLVEQIYKSVEEMRGDFKAGKLHPTDFKKAVQPVLKERLKVLSADKELKGLLKPIDLWAKKSAKKGGAK